MLIRNTINVIFSIVGILIILGVVFGYVPFWYIVVIGVTWFFITTYGVLNIRAKYFLKSYSSNDKIDIKAVAITFDDGPDENTIKILEVLNRYKAKATFFCIGKHMDTYPEITKQIISEGHVIGNHTYSHSQLIDLYSTNRFVKEIEETDKRIKAVSGKLPLLFRPPYGITNPNIARAIKKKGHHVIGWNKRSFDTILPSEKVILNRITKNIKAGDVILLHDTKLITVTVLEQLLLFLQENNYTAVTVDKLFSIQPYA